MTMQRKCVVLFVLCIVMKITNAQSESEFEVQQQQEHEQQQEPEQQQEELSEQTVRSFVPQARRVIYAPEMCVHSMALDHFGRCRVVW